MSGYKPTFGTDQSRGDVRDAVITGATVTVTTTSSSVASGHSVGSNVSSSNNPFSTVGVTGVKSKNGHPTGSEVIIENALLAFIRSEMLRNDKFAVVHSVVSHFTLDEMKIARELLYRQTGTIRYTFRGLDNPATSNQRSTHCAESIVEKFKDLDRLQKLPKVVCGAEDLFRLTRMKDNESTLEQRLSLLEKRLRKLNLGIKSLISLVCLVDLCIVTYPGRVRIC